MLPFCLTKLPDFLIIGAQKAGTTTLFDCLRQHPQISMPGVKEVHFFDLNYEKGIDWYKKHFRMRIPFRRRIAGEASPYYLFHPVVPERVSRHLPQVKLIVLLRNPIERAYSHFRHEIKHKTESLTSFEEAIKQESNRILQAEKLLIAGQIEKSSAHQSYSYISRGMYARQIERWLNNFPLSQMLFIKSEDFFSNPKNELAAIYKFLEVREVFPKNIIAQNTNNYPGLSPDLSKKTALLFDKDGEKLTRLIGDKFQWDF